MINNMHKGYMARPKPLAQGELLTHRDEIDNHKHCNRDHKVDRKYSYNVANWRRDLLLQVVEDGYGGGEGFRGLDLDLFLRHVGKES